ncbi:MAG: hypothetical protein K5787_17570 [Lentisphaeria bacterium]|nr:hypothetical protein [Lentisphaeria bacterium]
MGRAGREDGQIKIHATYQMTVPSRHIIIRDNVFCNTVKALILHHAEKTMEKIDICSWARQFS